MSGGSYLERNEILEMDVVEFLTEVQYLFHKAEAARFEMEMARQALKK